MTIPSIVVVAVDISASSTVTATAIWVLIVDNEERSVAEKLVTVEARMDVE